MDDDLILYYRNFQINNALPLQFEQQQLLRGAALQVGPLLTLLRPEKHLIETKAGKTFLN